VRRRAVTVVYVFVVVVVCPLVALNLAVAGVHHGFGWLGFFIVLLGLPVVGVVLGGVLLRSSSRAATLGATGAVAATFLLFIVLFFLALRTLTF
jgi:hypothetical protein